VSHDKGKMREKLGFFRLFHRSIVDPTLYAQEASSRTSKPVRYILRLVLLATLISAIANTARTIDPADGLGVHLGGILSGCRIDKGVLQPSQPTPYVPRTDHLAAVLSLLSGNNNMLALLADTPLVIDTSYTPVAGTVPLPRAVLGRTQVLSQGGLGMPAAIPYTAFVSKDATVDLTVERLTAFVRANTVPIFVCFFARDAFGALGNILSALLMLAAATYIFKIPRTLRFVTHVRLTCYALTPLVGGGALIAVTNVHSGWAWYLFFMTSLVVLLRGIDAASRPTKPAPGTLGSRA